jgi:hypothetical protein
VRGLFAIRVEEADHLDMHAEVMVKGFDGESSAGRFFTKPLPEQPDEVPAFVSYRVVGVGLADLRAPLVYRRGA